MAHTKQLLDPEDVTDLIKAIKITKESFSDDSGRQIIYNRIQLVLENDDSVHVKMSPEAKLGLYYLLKNDTSSVK